MKTGVEKRTQRQARAASRSRSEAAADTDSALQRRLDRSKTMQRQREQIENVFGRPVQRQAPEEEELLQGKFSQPVQREIDEEELLQGKFDGPLQRREEEEEELLQGKFAPTVQLEQEAASNRTGMPDNLKTGLETLSGQDMSDVRVHYNSARPAQLNAHAFAQGNEIHLGPGQERHLPHEAWHTVQQREGRVEPTMTLGGEQINDDAGLEQEADIMGEKASRFSK